MLYEPTFKNENRRLSDDAKSYFLLCIVHLLLHSFVEHFAITDT